VDDAPSLEEIGKRYLMELKASPELHLRSEEQDHIQIPPEAVRALELVYNPVTNSKKGSLLELLDSTLTAMGHRELYRRLIAPWSNIEKINSHLDLVEFLVMHPSVLEDVRVKLRGIADLERICSVIRKAATLR